MANPKKRLLERLAIPFDDVGLGKQIGEGTNCRVYEGSWKSKNRRVAIKTLSGGLQEDEIEILEKFDHPNVIRLLGIVSSKPSFFIISELAERGAVYHLIHKKHHYPSKEQAMEWAKEIAEGMNYLHHMKVTHRDLKSKSVFVTEDWTIKLGGFRHAKVFDHTALQTMAGTLRWMAPEFLMGEPVGLSCDVFSYGMVLLEILTCDVPYAGIGDIMVNGKIASGITPDIPTSCEPYLAQMLKMCWKTDPKARPTFSTILTILETKSVSSQRPGSSSAQPRPGTDSPIDGAGTSSCEGGTKVRELEKKDVQIEEGIGMGRTCRVYKGWWQSQNMAVAVKTLITGDVGTCTKEIEILARLHHPNIVQFFGMVRAKPSYYILTELAANASLFKFLHTDKLRPDHDQTQRWPIELARGVNYLHERSLAHRDLKSKSVLLTDTWTIKLAGFGSAKVFDHSTIQTFAGTCRWMAPEVINCESAVSMPCDVFSFGMVVLEIHTCDLPYAEVPDMLINARIAAGQIPDIPSGCCEPYMIELLEKCWEMEPSERPSFNEVLSALENKGNSLTKATDASDDGSLKDSDLPRLLKNLKAVEMLWYPIGMALEIDPAVLRRIAGAGGDPSASLRTLLTQWLSIRDSLPTVKVLAEALKSPMVNDEVAANSLLQEFR